METKKPEPSSLEKALAANLQARMSWPKAEACAADVAAQLDRMALDSPLTCEHCKKRPAKYAEVQDWKRHRLGRQTHLVCEECREYDVSVTEISLVSNRLYTLTFYRLIAVKEE